jgi:molecular chaperone GrpE (heat shock protein)
MSQSSNPPFAGPPGSGSPHEPTLRRVCTELINLRERTDRQHKLFEQALSQVRDDLQTRFDRFAADVQQAYQRLKEDLTGEKRVSLALLNALVDVAIDLGKSAAAGGSDAVAVAARRADAVLAQFGVQRYDAEIGSTYQARLHERVGTRAVQGLAPGQVAQQIEPGYTSRQGDFTPRRAKVLVSE